MSISVELLWSNDPLPINEIIENPTVVVNLPIGGTIITSNVTQSYVDDQDALLQTQIDTKADQVNLDQTNAQVELNRLSIPTKADAADLSMLAQLVDTKADADAVNQSLSLKADLVGGVVPAAQLPSGVAIGETSSTAYRGDRGKIAFDHSQSQGNPHNTTTSDISEGTKLFFTEPRVRETVLTGLNTNTATPALATDQLLVAIGKLQAQINNIAPPVWVNATSIGTTHAAFTGLQFAKINGLLWVRGNFSASASISAGTNLFLLTNPSYRLDMPSGFISAIRLGEVLAFDYDYGAKRILQLRNVVNSSNYFTLNNELNITSGVAGLIQPTAIGRLLTP